MKRIFIVKSKRKIPRSLGFYHHSLSYLIIPLIILLIFPLALNSLASKPPDPNNLGYLKVVTKDGYVNTGIMALTEDKKGISAAHIFENGRFANVTFQGKTYRILKWEQLRPNLSSPDIRWPTWAEIESDIIEITLENAPPKEIKRWQLQKQSPEPNSTVYIPAIKRSESPLPLVEKQWQKKIVTVVTGYGMTAGVPMGAYKIIRWLAGLPNSDEQKFSIGDSGGPWINHNGEIIAITSRISDIPLSGQSQTIYGSGVWENPTNPKTKRGFPAIVPLGLGIFLLWLANLLAKRGKPMLDYKLKTRTKTAKEEIIKKVQGES